jgi:NDP-sugar pyrophosphorylase family protein
LEAIILAGGKAERLGDAAEGRPKSLVPVCGKPLVGYQVARLAAAGVERVIVSCAAGEGELFARELAGLGVEIVLAEEPERLGRGGGIRFAARKRRERGDVYVLNGDELLDVDFVALGTHHERRGAAVTITVARPPSPFGLVDLDEDDVVTGFREAGQVPYWVNCGVYIFGEEGLDRLPERGDHETTTFPDLVAERRLRAYRHEGLWLTVNTPKDLRRAEEQIAHDPGWLAPAVREPS